MDWDSLIDEAGVAELLPGDYARFARPVREGLVHFLQGLSSRQQATILQQQAMLGGRASTAERLGGLARACPVLHKLGQTLARDHRLAPELRDHLRPLESLPPATPLAPIAKQLASELGPLDRLGVRLADQALAEASVAVVVPFDFGPARRRGVFKVLKPGVEEELQHELELLQDVGRYLDERCRALGIPELDYREAFEQVSSKLSRELQLDEEQRRLHLAGRLYAEDREIQVPALLAFCTPRITAMERVDGVKVSDHPAADPGARRRLAELVFRAIVLRPLFARGEWAIFHCDPHPGNLLLGADGRLALLDWSLASWLSEAERALVTQIMLAGVMLDGAKLQSLLVRLSQDGRADLHRLPDVIAERLAALRRGQMPGLTWLVSLLDAAAQQARLRPAPDMMLFRKSLLTLEGTVGEIDREFSVDGALFRHFLGHFLAEGPARWFQEFSARELPTRVSNADLAELTLSSPLAAARFWLAELRDLLNPREQEPTG